MSPSADVLVVGAGVFGVWTAHHLMTAGARVTLIDAYGPGNSRASSGDESRIIRCGYGADAIYTRWARRSLAAWRALAARARTASPLFHQCGVLWFAREGDPYGAQTRATLEAEGHPVEALDSAALLRRYPHINADGLGLALLEPDCGVLMARRLVQVLAADLVARGAQLLRARVEPPRGERRRPTLALADGADLAAARIVFTCGPWLPKLFPGLLGGRIRPTRQVVVYFGTPPGDTRFGPDFMPAWVDFGAGIYGVPELEARGLKVGIDRHGPPFDPDAEDRTVDAESVGIARDWLRARIPALADAPVVESRVCQYENTSTGDFLIDRHPEFDNVWFAGGGSGHGFKHGPAVGEYVAAHVLEGGDPEPRFALATKGTDARRAVF